MPHTFTPSGMSWQYLFTLFNIMNGQPCCIVNLSKPVTLLVVPAFLNIGTFPQAIAWRMPRQDGGWWIYPASLDIFVCGRLIWLIFALFSTIPGLLRFLTVDVFPMVMMRLELKTCWFLDGNLTVLAIKTCIGHKDLYV